MVVTQAGERADPDTLKHFHKHLNIPIIDHWWQTETGWPMVAFTVFMYAWGIIIIPFLFIF